MAVTRAIFAPASPPQKWPGAAGVIPRSLVVVSRRSREKFDSDVSRAFLGVMGISIVAAGICIVVFVVPASSAVNIVGSSIALLGSVILFLGVFGSNKQAESWAERLGNHEITIVFLLVAYGIVWVLNRKKV